MGLQRYVYVLTFTTEQICVRYNPDRITNRSITREPSKAPQKWKRIMFDGSLDAILTKSVNVTFHENLSSPCKSVHWFGTCSFPKNEPRSFVDHNIRTPSPSMKKNGVRFYPATYLEKAYKWSTFIICPTDMIGKSSVNAPTKPSPELLHPTL